MALVCTLFKCFIVQPGASQLFIESSSTQKHAMVDFEIDIKKVSWAT